MKKGTPLSELTLAELQAKKKTVQGAVIGLGIVMFFGLITLIYVAITAKKPGMLAISGGVAITLLPLINSLKQLNEEIKKRTS